MRVVFLDIDGPMIPSGQYLINPLCSFERQFPAIPIAVMNTLCKKSGAKIVFNTTHNKSFPDVPDVEHCLWRQGLKEEHVVTGVYKTLYPELDRETAVSEWLARHPDVTEWVAFDDARFTEKENLIWVDPDTGLTPFHLNEALEFFGCPPYLIYV